MSRLTLMLAFATGCATVRPAEVGTVVDANPRGEYRLGCADVVAVRFLDRPDWDCVAAVDLDGSVPLGDAGAPPAAGGTLAELHAAVCATVGVAADRVTVELTDPRAGRVYVVGPENRAQRAVGYVGPERVVAFLARSGAVQPGCAELRDVHVTRPNVAAGGSPQTVWVDVEAIVRDGDNRTNVVLEPSDVVTVGETRRSRFARLLPGWARAGYRAIAGVAPTGWAWTK